MGIKIIQIGAGIRGRHWVEFVKNHPDVDCIAIVEPDAASLEKAKGLLPASDCRFFQDIGEALKSVKADAALVVSPSATHADVSIHCLDAGLTVMVEKPLAVTVEETGPAFKAGEDTPATVAARWALEQAWGTESVDIGVGGSIPFIADLAEVFPKAEILVTGIEDPDTRAHSQNESLHLGDWRNAILAEAALLARLGGQL